MNVVSVDCGRKITKITTHGQTKTFPSVIGGWVSRDLDTYGNYEIELNGLKYFVGELAQIESHTSRENGDSTKLTDEFKILTLTAIAAMGVCNNITLITAVPVAQHNKNTKDAIIEMFKGDHLITINGIAKFMAITDVLVTVEGAGIYYSNQPVDGYCHILDIGSRTCNMLTMYNNRFVNARSYTLNYGCFIYEENTILKQDFAAKIAADVKKKWLDHDKNVMYIGGGGAVLVGDQLKQHFPRAKIVANPIESNAIGFYKMGVSRCQKGC